MGTDRFFKMALFNFLRSLDLSVRESVFAVAVSCRGRHFVPVVSVAVGESYLYRLLLILALRSNCVLTHISRNLE